MANTKQTQDNPQTSPQDNPQTSPQTSPQDQTQTVKVTFNDYVWSLFLTYLYEICPNKIFVPKGVKTLISEARAKAPDDPRLFAIERFITEVARPDSPSDKPKFIF